MGEKSGPLSVNKTIPDTFSCLQVIYTLFRSFICASIFGDSYKNGLLARNNYSCLGSSNISLSNLSFIYYPDDFNLRNPVILILRRDNIGKSWSYNYGALLFLK